MGLAQVEQWTVWGGAREAAEVLSGSQLEQAVLAPVCSVVVSKEQQPVRSVVARRSLQLSLQPSCSAVSLKASVKRVQQTSSCRLLSSQRCLGQLWLPGPCSARGCGEWLPCPSAQTSQL